MSEFGISREEATRLNGYYTAVVRQLETNLRMPMTDSEVEQTRATIRIQFRGPIGVW